MRRSCLALALAALFAVATPALASSEPFRGGDYRTIAQFAADGDGWRLMDASYQTIGRIEPDGAGWVIRGGDYLRLGALERDGDGWRARDASYSTLGYLRPDGKGWRVLDASHLTIGRVDADGTARDASYHTVARLPSAEPVPVALYFLFFPGRLRP